MSFFSKTLTSLGIGAAKVDAVLDADTYRPGETVSGELHIQGGNEEQNVEGITLSLVTQFVEKVDDKKVTRLQAIDHFSLQDQFTIRAGEKRKEPFSFQLALDTPVTMGSTKVWVQTGLDIRQALDPTDKDVIQVQPVHMDKGAQAPLPGVI